jgi:PadR family transcriptional regulator PadR
VARRPQVILNPQSSILNPQSIVNETIVNRQFCHLAIDPFSRLSCEACQDSLGEWSRPIRDLLRGTLESMILRIVADGPDHGYGIGRKLEQALGDDAVVEDGSLYPGLYRLERRRLVHGSWGRSEANRRARFYTLTPKGRRALVRRSRAWASFSAAVTRLLAGARP